MIVIFVGILHYSPLSTLPIPRLIDLHDDIAPELIGIGLTVILIDWAVTRQAKIDKKAQLSRQLQSKYPDVAEMARIEMAHEDWFHNGSLIGANLWGANLSGFDDLWAANLSGANLQNADLSKADLWDADLSGANLRGADLSGAELGNADLSRAKLGGANLSGAKLPHDLVINPDLWQPVIIDSRTLRWSRD